MKKHLLSHSEREHFPILNRRKTVVISLILLAICAVSVIISTGSGSMPIAPLDVIRSLIGIGAEDHTMVIQKLRLPRITVALLVGASLAVSGAILQSVIRNPLASPDIIGITGGASVFALLSCIMGSAY